MAPVETFNPHLTIGASEIAALVDYMLFGVTTIQAYIYYGRFPEDSSKLKALSRQPFSLIRASHHTRTVLLTQVICIGHGLYTFTISDFGQPLKIVGPVPKSLSAAVFTGGLIAVTVQSFFAYRIYAFTKKLYIPIISWFMSFVRLLGVTAVCVTTARMTSAVTYEAQWSWLLTSLWSVSAANDLTITATLVTHLIIQRSHAHKRTVALVDKLVIWTIETGALTSLAAIILVICIFVAVRHPDTYLTLNSRTVLRALENNSMPITTFKFATSGTSSDHTSKVTQQYNVKDTTTSSSRPEDV
ncbi:hypothetical protein DFH08DRAFT_813475 [Mycena albidolilacea]|uniref:DUF6534 domain-containing protein n=1 Tax=Mycena albidolilacea TaxID=1033008 RepID=A0AAD6ZRP4_9AGAR|nr:hypothetical protein DFH08DRAFT_813475 [Mycena albidolilacea]